MRNFILQICLHWIHFATMSLVQHFRNEIVRWLLKVLSVFPLPFIATKPLSHGLVYLTISISIIPDAVERLKLFSSPIQRDFQQLQNHLQQLQQQIQQQPNGLEGMWAPAEGESQPTVVSCMECKRLKRLVPHFLLVLWASFHVLSLVWLSHALHTRSPSCILY